MILAVLADHAVAHLFDNFDLDSFILGLLAGGGLLHGLLILGEKLDPGRPIMTLSQAIAWVWHRARAAGG